MADPQDLITTATATNFLAACGPNGIAPTAAQVAILPQLITDASQLICREARRYFTLTSYDEVLSPWQGQTDKSQSDFLSLRCLPVQSVTGFMGNWTPALSVWNANTAAQAATVQYAFTGDVEITTTITGLTLTLSLNGTSTTSTITWGATPYTVANLATAINALGNGWNATAFPAMAGWAASALWGTLGPKDASVPPGASLGLFTTTIPNRVDIQGGLVYLPCDAPQTSSPGAWWQWPASADVALGQWSYGGQYRVTYTAGWPTIPAPITTACCELVKYTLDRMATDGSLKSEKAREYQYEVRTAWSALPDWVRQAVYKYLVVF